MLQVGGANAQPHPSDYDPSNTTLFIGGLSSSVTEEDLRVLFGRYGDIVYTKIPPGKGCGFVQFVQRPAAEAAMGQMQVRHPGSAAPILADLCCSGFSAAPVWSHT